MPPMTVLPDPVELSSSLGPSEPGRRPLLSGWFWLMLGFCALCLVASVAVVTLGPRMTAPRPAPAVALPPTPTPPAPLTYAPPAPAPVTTPVLPGADAAALSAQIQHLESDETRLLNAAAGALAAASLSDVAAQPRPFADDLAVYARLLPASPDIIALTPLAQQGAPTRAALATELNDIAAKVSVAAHAPAKDASVLSRLAYLFSRVVSVRRIDLEGGGSDAALARAERRAEEGDLEGAITVLDTLPAGARAALAPWREQAIRRIDIDRHIAGLRAQAVTDLAAARGTTP